MIIAITSIVLVCLLQFGNTTVIFRLLSAAPERTHLPKQVRRLARAARTLRTPDRPQRGLSVCASRWQSLAKFAGRA